MVVTRGEKREKDYKKGKDLAFCFTTKGKI